MYGGVPGGVAERWRWLGSARPRWWRKRRELTGVPARKKEDRRIVAEEKKRDVDGGE